MSNEILTAVRDLQEKVNDIDVKLERMNTELAPVVHLVRGNGRAGLEARMYANEQRVESLSSNTQWSMRFGISALVGAIATILWQIINKG